MNITLPFTDAQTYEMPEMHATMPMRAVQNVCGWCGIKLSAIPQAPVPGPDGKYYHPGGCMAAARGTARGERVETAPSRTAV